MITGNLILVIVTILVSLVAMSNQELMIKMLHRPYNEHHSNEKYRLLTSGFIHADYFHLFINMFVLYQFGAFVEYKFVNHFGFIGSFIYVGFYILTIIMANLKTHFMHKDNFSYSALGASGATSAVLFSYIFFEPTSKLGLYMIIPVPAIIFGVLYLWYSSWSAGKNQDNIGHEAHFYGAVAGFLITMALYPNEISIFFTKLIYGW
ncbi:MAG TPA: rhomboid family intramembrane serine protease [Saprospiraceae bacterium]|nr:rhomboid family intramembrane serine protease [Saprospiraceae bacterium]